MSMPAAERVGPKSLTIGEVLDVLRPDFPDVSVSKIRFLEDQGLVEPDRTPAGYRKFRPDHVERLRQVLTLQRDHFLPLRVIRQHLSAEARAEDGSSAVVPPARLRGLPAVGARAEQRLERAELIEASGADEPLVDALEEHGLLRRAGPESRQWYDADDLEVTRAAVALAQHGVHPRHLRMLRIAADREVDLVEQVVAPVRRSRRPSSRSAAQEQAREVAASCLRLHAALVAAGLDARGSR